MDPITHGLLGAAAARALTKKGGKKTLVAGALAAMAADLDVFIHSSADPMLGVAFHRHFTHSFFFWPVGALIVAVALRAFRPFREDWGGVYWTCFVGYLTHPLLDACTAYGTMLLWPFSDARLAWDSIAIVDPVFTAVLLVGVAWSWVNGRTRAVAAALVFCALYMGFGEWQNRRGEAAQAKLAGLRKHAVSKRRVMPTLGNLIVWRSVYEADGRLWSDALRAPWSPVAPVTFAEGASVTLFREEGLPDGFLANPSLKDDWEKFFWFSQGYVALSGRGDVVADMRYSSETGGFQPLWGIVIPEDVNAAHVGWKYFRDNRRQAVIRLWRQLTGKKEES